MHLLVPAAIAFVAVVALPVATAADPTAGSRPPTGSQAQVSAAGPARPAVSALGVGSATGTGTRSPAPSTAGQLRRNLPFGWPLSPRPVILRRFEQPRDQWSRGHRGVDLLAGVGQPVLSAGDGIVAFSGVVAGRGVITVRHSGGLRTSYEPADDRLTAGTLVHRGARIGVVASTAGHCAPLTCLHWGAISGATYRDPLLLLGFARPILLPLG